jgi:hypothetical protein
MGNEASSAVSKEDLLEIKKKQLLLEKQNKKIREDLKKEKQSKKSLKEEINELKKTKAFVAPILTKPVETIRVTVNNSSLEIDPFQLFGLDADCTADDIKKVYKKLVLQYHPDKSGYDSTSDYRVIQKAYSTLVHFKEEEAKTNALVVQTVETKGHERKQLDTDIETRVNQQFQPASGSGFDKKRFNEMFDQNKYVDENEQGYEQWLRGQEPAEELPKINTYTKQGFNDTFEQYAKKQTSNREIVQYIDPECYVSYKGGFDNLGEKVEDYTTDGKYTDLKKAYTSSNLLHPGEVKPREQYTNIGQLKAARDAPVEISTDERQFVDQRKKREVEMEINRVTRVREKDKNIDDFYTRMHGRAIELPNYKK